MMRQKQKLMGFTEDNPRYSFTMAKDKKGLDQVILNIEAEGAQRKDGEETQLSGTSNVGKANMKEMISGEGGAETGSGGHSQGPATPLDISEKSEDMEKKDEMSEDVDKGTNNPPRVEIPIIGKNTQADSWWYWLMGLDDYTSRKFPKGYCNLQGFLAIFFFIQGAGVLYYPDREVSRPIFIVVDFIESPIPSQYFGWSLLALSFSLHYYLYSPYKRGVRGLLYVATFNFTILCFIEATFAIASGYIIRYSQDGKVIQLVVKMIVHLCILAACLANWMQMAIPNLVCGKSSSSMESLDLNVFTI